MEKYETSEDSLDLAKFRPEGFPQGWKESLETFFSSPAGANVRHQIESRIRAGVNVFPPDPFRILRCLAPENVRVVILGQDPYHEKGQATGMAFSVPKTLSKLPPSLKNIFKEIARETGGPIRTDGDLTDWVEQGVFLLNAVLTVEEGLAASHSRLGWQGLTDAILFSLLQTPRPRVFLLWGAHAQEKERFIYENSMSDTLILKANHPSPLSARRPPVPFIGCDHFIEVNRFLAEHGEKPIVWTKSSADFLV